MAGQRPWITRIPEIIDQIEARPPGVHLERRDIEALFGVGRSAATELLHAAGAASATGGAVIAPSRMLYYLRTGPEAQAYDREVRRRQILGDKLEIAAATRRQKSVPVPASYADCWLRLKDLPGVRIAPGELRVEYVGGAQELMGKLFQLSQAIANDWDRFQQLCGER